MDYRENAIIVGMLEGDGSASWTDMAKRLGVGNQYMHKLVSRMNLGLRRAGIPEVQVIDSGMLAFSEFNTKVQGDVQHYLASCDYDAYNLIRNERQTLVTIIMLDSMSYVSADKLANHLRVSRGTIIGDMPSVKAYLSDSSITMESRPSYGYRMVAPESAIRAGLTEILSLNLSHQHFSTISMSVFQRLLAGEVGGTEERVDLVRSIIKDTERVSGHKLSDYSFRVIEYEMLVWAHRWGKGARLELCYPERIDESSKYPMARNILDQLSASLGTGPVSRDEVRALVQSLRTKSYAESSTTHVDEMAVAVQIEDTILGVMQELGIGFYLEKNLHNMLVDHMRSVIYRAAATTGQICNPLKDDIIHQYPEVFAAVGKRMRPLEAMTGSRFSDDEISMLAMFFGAILEQRRTELARSRKVRVCVVCDLGRLVFSYIRSQLKILDDLIEIVDERTGHEGQSDVLGIQLVIATVAYSLPGAQTIRVESPMLSAEELADIRQVALDISANDMLENTCAYPGDHLPHLPSLVGYPTWEHTQGILPARRILLQAENATLGEAVSMAASLLERDGVIDDGGRVMMDQSVVGLGSRSQRARIFCPGVLVSYVDEAHGAMADGMSVVRLTHPMRVEGVEKPIRYAVGFSYLESDYLSDMLHAFIYLLHNGTFPKVMDSFSDSSAAFECFSTVL